MQQPFFREIIHQELAARTGRNPAYSLRAFAKGIGVSPGTLSQILNGKRVPSVRLTKKLIQTLGLNPKETLAFLHSVATAHRGRTLQRKSRFFHGFQMSVPEPADDAKELSLELFQVISDWYHYAIMMLVETEDARLEPRWIAAQLGIGITEATLALNRLLKLGLLKRVNGRLKADGAYLTTADKNLTTPALRKHQRQILEKALASLDNDPLEVRSSNSLTMAIDPDRLPKAKLMIEKFNRELCAYLEGGKRKRVYQLSVNLFPMQKTRSPL
jgi:uncharacterized protein (TIGR02147 family)